MAVRAVAVLDSLPPEAEHQGKDTLVVLAIQQDKIIQVLVVVEQAEQVLTELLLPVAQAAQEHYLHQQVLITVAVAVVETTMLPGLAQRELVV